MLPTPVVDAYVEEELPGARSWADREGLELTVLPGRPILRVELTGPPAPAPDGLEGAAREAPLERYLLEAGLDDYRALPPEWRFLHPDTEEEIGAAGFPAQPQSPLGGASIFLPHSDPYGAVICAHFSRRAYGNGPHPDWGPPTNWENTRPGQVVARTLGDMLVRIALEVSASAGRMAPLP